MPCKIQKNKLHFENLVIHHIWIWKMLSYMLTSYQLPTLLYWTNHTTVSTAQIVGTLKYLMWILEGKCRIFTCLWIGLGWGVNCWLSLLRRILWIYLLGWFTKIEIGIFQRDSKHFVHFGNKIIPAKYELRILKFRGATGQWTFVNKFNGIYGSFSVQHKKVMVIFTDCAKNLWS